MLSSVLLCRLRSTKGATKVLLPGRLEAHWHRLSPSVCKCRHVFRCTDRVCLPHNSTGILWRFSLIRREDISKSSFGQCLFVRSASRKARRNLLLWLEIRGWHPHRFSIFRPHTFPSGRCANWTEIAINGILEKAGGTWRCTLFHIFWFRRFPCQCLHGSRKGSCLSAISCFLRGVGRTRYLQWINA